MRVKPTIPRVCEACGTAFLGRSDRVKVGQARFCSQACTTADMRAHAVTSLLRRFEARGSINRSGECWLWTGKRDRDGYGKFCFQNDTQGAHRVALGIALGRPLTLDEHACHACDTPACVRNDEPDIYVIRGIARPRFGHLWMGNNLDNIADRNQKGRTARGRSVILRVR